MRFRSNFLKCLAFFLLITSYGYSSGSQEVFGKYPNPYFVESRACKGQTIPWALDAGFSQVRSIESSDGDYARIKQKFKRDKRVQIFHGKSSEILSRVIQDITQPVTFWLNNYSSENVGKKAKKFSLIQELNEIANHPIKTHTLLIDGVRSLGKRESDHMTLNDLIGRILKINPDYCFEFENGDRENDILVAFIDDEL